MLEKIIRKAKKWLRNAAVIAAFAAATYSPLKAQQPKQEQHRKPIAEHVVHRGEYLSQIARDRLHSQGKNPSMDDIIRETDRIASLNGKGTVEEYPWHKGYDCAAADYRDSNCIYPDQNIILNRQEVPPSSPAKYTKAKAHERTKGTKKANKKGIEKGSKNKEPYNPLPLISLGLLGAAGIGAGAKYLRDKDREYERLEGLVDIKNDNPYKTLDHLVEDRKPWLASEDSLKKDYENYFRLYRQELVTKKISVYDHAIAPEGMKHEMVTMYQDSEKSLDEISEYLTEKYGMHISSSTVSRRARKELGKASRKEARQALEEKMAA